MRKRLTLIILLLLELVSFVLLSDWDIASTFGLWTLLYIIILYRNIFNLNDTSTHGASMNYDTISGELNDLRQEASGKHSKYRISHINSKWVYLIGIVINGCLSYLFTTL